MTRSRRRQARSSPWLPSSSSNPTEPQWIGLGAPRRLLGPAALGIPRAGISIRLDGLELPWRREAKTPTFELSTVPPPFGSRGDDDLHLAVVIDESPSEQAVDPHGYRHIAARRIMDLLCTELKHNRDRLAVVHFSQLAQPCLAPTSPHTKAGRQALRQMLRPVGGGSGTDIVAGLRAAAHLVPAVSSGQVVVVLLTDGYDNHSTAELSMAVRSFPPGSVHAISIAEPLPSTWDGVLVGSKTVIPSMSRPDEVEWTTAQVIYQALGLGWSGPTEPPGAG